MIEKEEKMLRVAEATLRTLAQFGLSGVSFARVARASGVSRAWLYKYIGGSQKELIEFTLDTFGKMYGKLDQPIKVSSPDEWKERVLGRFDKLLEDTVRYPWILAIFYRYRGSQGPLGEKIREIEEKFFRNQVVEMQRLFGRSKEQARMVAEVFLAARMGLAFRWGNTELSKHVKKEELLGFMSDALGALIEKRRGGAAPKAR